MIKKIENFGKVYNENIYPSNGMVYAIQKASVVKTLSEPELLEYIDIKLIDNYNQHKSPDYSVGIFADNKNGYNLACVYKRGESSPVFTDKGMSSVHFKTTEFFKTYVVTLINRAL